MHIIRSKRKYIKKEKRKNKYNSKDHVVRDGWMAIKMTLPLQALPNIKLRSKLHLLI